LKIFIMVVLLAVSSRCFSDDWTDAQKATAAVFSVATVVDYGQTMWISTHCHTEYIHCQEQNPILGPYPSTKRVTATFAAEAVAVYLIADFLEGDRRTAFLAVMSVIEVGMVGNNLHAGVKFGF
jgi:hypothetical protein